jgi:hypothetical protein
VPLSQYITVFLAFQLNEAVYGFTLAHPNCQYSYSCDLGPLSKVKHCDTMTNEQVTEMAIK